MKRIEWTPAYLGLLANELMIWELASQSGYKMLLYLDIYGVCLGSFLSIPTHVTKIGKTSRTYCSVSNI